MNTSNNNITLVETYYQNMMEKNFEAMEKCLHDDVDFIGPLSTMSGKEAVVNAAKNLSAMCESIIIKAKFSAADQVMLAYDFYFPKSIGKLPAAVLMNIKNNQISRIELFYDGRPFDAI